MSLAGTMNGDKRQPQLEAETEEKEKEEEEQTVLLRKTFRQEAQSNISSTDSDDLYSDDSQGPKFVIRDEQGEGTGFANGSSRLEVDGNHHVIYEVSPTDEIEAVATRKTDAQNENGAAIKFQRDQIPLTVANPISKGAIEEQTSYYTSLDNGTTENKRVDFRTENGNEVADLYLERIYEKPSSHNFYCPNCQACITKVIIRDREWVNNTVSEPIPTQADKFRCTSCLSFLVPIGIWLFPNLASREEEVSSGQGNNVENIGIRERETFQVSQETRDHQQSPVDRATVSQSVGYAVTDKNKGDHVTPAHPSHIATSAEGRIVQENTVYSEKVIPDRSVGNAVADETQKSDCAVPNSTPTHPSLHTTIAEGVVPDKGVISKEGNMVESIIVGRPQPLQESAEPIYDQGIQAASINKPQVSDQLVEFDMWSNDKALETKVDSTVDLSVLDGAKDSKKGSAVENIVVGIPYPSHETNGSMLDIDRQASTVNKAQVLNQSNGFAVLLESEIETKAKSTPGLTSLEEMMSKTVTDTLEAKKGIDVENVVVGIPYPSQEPKGGLLDRFGLSALINKAPVPDQSAEVGKTEILKTPEPVVATVPDASPVAPSLGAGTAESVLDSAVNSREGLVAIPIDDSLDEQVDPEPSRLNRWEVLKSVVYGGLAESITSLGIVASAASADTATGNIVALALANLISGLFILGHNLAGLKSEQFSRASSNETDDQQVDRYEDVLGNRENYILHFTIAILSFLVFGLVPPLVYGFSFTKSNDKDFKLAAVAGASLLCVILLAVVKAHIRRPNRWDVYVKSIVSYVAIAAGAGGLSYLAGDLIDKLIKKYGWFEQSPAALGLNLPLPGMSLAKSSWGSY